MKPIKENDRRYWDVVVFLVILIATFEIPYDLLVGYSNESTEHAFNILFYIVFGIDIILNLYTEQSVFDRKIEDYKMTTTLKASRKAYLKSFWFVVDVLAIFPFDLLFSSLAGLSIARTLRLTRLPRLFRAFRAMRGLKGVHLINKFAQAWQVNPSYARFVVIFLLIPWVAHVLACFYFFYEFGQEISYMDALNGVFMAFIETTAPAHTSLGGKITGYTAVLFGYIFFGAFIGNFATLFEKFDEQRSELLDAYKNWNTLFKKHPKVFDAALKKKIRNHTKISLSDKEHFEEEKLIAELPNELEQLVRERMKSK